MHPTSADSHCQTVPPWTAFSAKLNKENILLPSNVGYCFSYNLHLACSYWKRFGDAGLADLMIESGIIGMGSVNGVLNGKQYNRAVRMNKILYEAFWRIRWESFCKWLENSRQVVDVDHITHVIQKFKDSIFNGSLEILLEDPAISYLYQLEQNFRDMDKGSMAEFWNSFLDIVSLLWWFIRSIRLGNWELHLSCIREMLPWIHIYDRVNYARCLPYYWIQMITLKDTHPQAYSELNNGAFAVQRQENSGFSQIAVDHTIEQTVNRDTETIGGIVGFSLKKGAVERWFLQRMKEQRFVRICTPWHLSNRAIAFIKRIVQQGEEGMKTTFKKLLV